MKRNLKRMVAIFGVVLTVVCSVAPSYYVYADEPVSQEVTSDDNIVQKLFYYSMSAIGALNKTSNVLTSLPTTISNNVKETIASLMNGGGIYVDANGDYVFSNDACDQIYQALSSNSNVDANVISNFSNFTFNADGYVNAQYLTDCEALTSYFNISGSGSLDGVNNGNGTSGDYLLCCARNTNGSVITTTLSAYDIGDVAYLAIINGTGSSSTWQNVAFYGSNGSQITVPAGYVSCCFDTSYNVFGNDNMMNWSYLPSYIWSARMVRNSGAYTSSTEALKLTRNNNYQGAQNFYNAFPTFSSAPSGVYLSNCTLNNLYFYSSKSIILGKSVISANTVYNNNDGILYNKFTNTTVNSTILNNNNWENIYNSYIQNVNVDFQENTSMSASDLRKIMKKYTGSVISAIESGSQDIEEVVSISNRYLQSISVDVRNISDKLDNMTGGGSGGGITPEQYNSIMGKLDDINDNAVDIASSAATISSDIDAIYEDTHGISSDMAILLENTGDTNTNLVAIDTLLQQINNKLRNRRTDNPLPDPDFWDNLDDELDDYTNTMMEDLIFKLQMIGTVLQGVVPFGYLAVLNVMVNALAEEPEEPVFEIDLQSNGATAIPVDWQGTIDLSWVDDIMPVVRSFEVILFIIGLIWATFNVFTALGSLL